MKGAHFLSFIRVNIKSFYTPWRIILIIVSLLLLFIYGRTEIDRISSFFNVGYTYFDFLYYVFGSQFDQDHALFIERLTMLLPLILISYVTAIYCYEEGLLKSYMTIPRVKSINGWYLSHIVTLFMSSIIYVAIIHSCLAIASIGLSKAFTVAKNTFFPYIGEKPIYSVLFFICIQIIIINFFQMIQWIISLTTSNAIIGFIITMLSSMVILFTDFRGGILKWVPGVQLIVSNNDISPDFTNAIPVIWTIVYIASLSVLVIFIGWMIVRRIELTQMVLGKKGV